LTRSETSPNDQRVDLAAISRDVADQLADMAEGRGVLIWTTNLGRKAWD